MLLLLLFHPRVYYYIPINTCCSYYQKANLMARFLSGQLKCGTWRTCRSQCHELSDLVWLSSLTSLCIIIKKKKKKITLIPQLTLLERYMQKGIRVLIKPLCPSSLIHWNNNTWQKLPVGVPVPGRNAFKFRTLFLDHMGNS